MQKLQMIYLFIILCFSSHVFSENIAGFWLTIDDKTKKPSSVVAVYSYQDRYYGRIIGIYNEQGELEDTIYHPISRAPGIKGKPYYCGLDIVWDAKLKSEGRYKGHVVDPKHGKIYNAQLFRKGSNLILRGELFIFGKNITWPPFQEKDFNQEFKKPDVTTFVPTIPSVAAN